MGVFVNRTNTLPASPTTNSWKTSVRERSPMRGPYEVGLDSETLLYITVGGRASPIGD